MATSTAGEVTAIKPMEYPALYQRAAAASKQAQKKYLLFAKAEMWLVMIGAIGGGVTTIGSESLAQGLAAGTAFCLIFSLFASLLSRAWRFEAAWFNARSVAESVKTLAWRYMMGVEPFDLKKSQSEADRDFVEKLKIIADQVEERTDFVGGSSGAESSQISGEMKRLRALTFSEQKDIYLKQRLQDQKSWYNSRADENRRKGAMWYWTTISLQAVAIIVAIFMVMNPGWIYNPLGLLTTVIASLLSWIQLKRYEDLAKTYSVAYHELSFLEDLLRNVVDKSELDEFVVNTEDVISREHTMWHAKRTGTFWKK
jgi:hypothetical protein